MKTQLRILACSALACLTTPVVAGPPTGSVKLTSYSYSGNGCPQGSMALQLSQDMTALIIISDGSLWTGSISPIPRQTCTLSVGLSVPDGFQFYAGYADFREYASLDGDVTMNYKETKFFTGSSDVVGYNGSSCLRTGATGYSIFLL
jgi:hypothetical protein